MEGQYYVDEVCKRFLQQIKDNLGQDEVFSYRAAAVQREGVTRYKEDYYFPPCKLPDNSNCGLDFCLAIKYSLKKRS